jgi:secreted trypsin-like serine protease
MTWRSRLPVSVFLGAFTASAELLVLGSGFAHASCADRAGLSAPGPQPKIIGGVPARFKDFSWIATIARSGASTPEAANHLCGATWIGGLWLATAAHCVDGCEAGDLSIFLGGDRYGEAEGATKLQGPNSISEIHRLSGESAYGRRHYKGQVEQETATFPFNDLALIKLTEEPAQGEPVSVLKLMPASAGTQSKNARISGFGWVSQSSGPVAQLQSLDVEILPEADCSEKFENNLDKSMICAGRDNAGICDGDSGGGMIVEVNGGRFLAGIASWTRFCATKSGGSHADVYVNVARFSDWINETIMGNP